MTSIPYKKVLLKLSGESLMGKEKFGLSSDMLNYYAQEIKSILPLGVKIAIVIGAGNIYRGADEARTGIDRQQGDYMGMLATILNGMALQATIEKTGISTRLMTNLHVNQVAEPFYRRKALSHLEKDRVLILAGGTGNPNYTTDTAGVSKAIELGFDVIIKCTRVEGVYNKDPEEHPDAVMYDRITFQNALDKGYKIMDKAAFILCQEHNLPLVVMNFNEPQNLYRLLSGEKIGTLVTN